MTNPPLRQRLEALHHELQQARPVDPQTRALLDDLARDIQALLREPAPDAGGFRSLRERLAADVERFEAAHPVLARTAANVIDTLAFYGL